jgi:hypothetical protein
MDSPPDQISGAMPIPQPTEAPDVDRPLDRDCHACSRWCSLAQSANERWEHGRRWVFKRAVPIARALRLVAAGGLVLNRTSFDGASAADTFCKGSDDATARLEEAAGKDIEIIGCDPRGINSNDRGAFTCADCAGALSRLRASIRARKTGGPSIPAPPHFASIRLPSAGS